MKKQKSKTKKYNSHVLHYTLQNGITLIALVITIIIMLILAAVTITMAINGGLFGYAQNASAETISERDLEQNLAYLEDNLHYNDLIEKYSGSSEEPEEPIATGTDLEEILESISVVPANTEKTAFTISNDDLPEGLSIFYRSESESQFTEYNNMGTLSFTQIDENTKEYDNKLYIKCSMDNEESSIREIDLSESFCFVEGTKVLTYDGEKNIEDIKVGDLVYSYNQDTNCIETNKVLKKFVNSVSYIKCMIYTENGTIECTNLHPFFVNGKGWIEAKNIAKGDELIDCNLEKVKVLDIIEIIPEKTYTVYNFEVENNHNYFVGEDCVLTHNPVEKPNLWTEEYSYNPCGNI